MLPLPLSPPAIPPPPLSRHRRLPTSEDFSQTLSWLSPGSPYYRRVVGGSCALILVASLLLLARIAPGRRQPHRKLNEHTQAAATAHLGLAVCSCCVSLAAAGLGLLSKQWLYGILSTFIAFSQGIDGLFTWERYRLAYPDYTPSWIARGVVYTYIFMYVGSWAD